jgi:hypothetical protein
VRKDGGGQDGCARTSGPCEKSSASSKGAARGGAARGGATRGGARGSGSGAGGAGTAKCANCGAASDKSKAFCGSCGTLRLAKAGTASVVKKGGGRVPAYFEIASGSLSQFSHEAGKLQAEIALANTDAVVSLENNDREVRVRSKKQDKAIAIYCDSVSEARAWKTAAEAMGAACQDCAEGTTTAMAANAASGAAGTV